MVAQYLKGARSGGSTNTDPALALVPRTEKWLRHLPARDPVRRAQDFDIDYASIVIATADLASLKLDGVAVNPAAFTAIAGTLFSRGVIDLPQRSLRPCGRW